jgi:predicted transcriptional regulator
MGKQDASPLTETQREIMEVVWELGDATVSDVQTRIAARREVARNTVQTLMVRLEEKGWLRHVEQGRKFIYSAARPRTTSLGARVAHMVDFLFGGSPEQLVNALLEYRGLSESELQNIRDMIDQADREGADTTASKKKSPRRQRRNSGADRR